MPNKKSPFPVLGSLLCLLSLCLVVSEALEKENPYAPLPSVAQPLQDLKPHQGLAELSPRLLEVNSKYLKKDHRVNPETREVEIKEYVSIEGSEPVSLNNSFYSEVDDYTSDLNDMALAKNWLSSFIGKGDAKDAAGSASRLEWELPVQVPDWLKRLGADKPKLKINGSFKVILEGTATRGVPNSPDEWFPSFNLQNEPSFSVDGTIGRLIHVQINNEQGFGTNFRDQMKISYRGEGDELEDNIIQEISLGNIDLSLEGTQLTGYSEAHKGIFGLKTRLKFGDLHVSTVLSQEGGSHETQTLGVGEVESEYFIEDRQMSLYKHFFISQKDFFDYIDPVNGYGSTAYRSLGESREVRVFKLIGSTERGTSSINRTETTAYAWRYNPQTKQFEKVEDRFQKGVWKAMEVDKDYKYDKQKRMLTVHSGYSDISIAVLWTAPDIDPLPRKFNNLNDTAELVLIKPAGPTPVGLLDSLMWRNVYSIGSVKEEDRKGFRLTVVNNQNQESSSDQSFLTALGLTVPGKPNELNVHNEDIFDFREGLMILPCRTPNDSAGAAKNCVTPFKRISGDSKLYDISASEMSTLTSIHKFKVTSKQKQSTFDVTKSTYGVSGGGCLDITPGTERLMLDKTIKLERGMDYEVLYEVGQITLISPRAKAPNANIDVSYECTPAFQIQDKFLIGTRLRYDLDQFSPGSMVGATFLFKSQTSKDKRPQLDREPFNQFLVGFNTTLVGTPEWMTSIVNQLPFIDTKAQSRNKFDFEMAVSTYNPNTKGSALVDDFENSKRDFSFPLNLSSWTAASPPGGNPADPFYDANLDYRHKGAFIWHSNIEEQFSDIYSETKYARTNNRPVQILKFKLIPNDNFRGNSWGGVMRGVLAGLRNQQRKRILEVVVKGGDGQLGIDLGKISEDLPIAGFAPNGRLDTEVPTGQYVNKNDWGLDNKLNDDEEGLEWRCEPQCMSTRVTINERTDPAGDGTKISWTEPKKNDTDPSYTINSTEGNNKETSGFAYDTEDLNQDGSLSNFNQFVRYKVDLSKECTKDNFCEKLLNNWRKYQIPIYEKTQYELKSNFPTDIEKVLAEVNHTRLWFGKLSNGVTESDMYIARIGLMGNDWEESPRNLDYEVTPPPFVDGTDIINLPSENPDNNNLKVLVVNNREEAGYTPSPNTTIERDTDTDEPVQEQSLLLRYENLHPGEKVNATRLFPGQDRDLTQYGRLQLEVHPQPLASERQNKIDFVFKFGTDKGNEESDDYYEIRLPLDSGLFNLPASEIWRRHALDVSLKELSSLKASSDWISKRRASKALPHQYRTEDSLTLSVVGDPSLSRVNWMRIELDVHDDAPEDQTGEIWVNDFRLKGVNKLNGMALRTSFTSEFADFMIVSGGAKLDDGEFSTFTGTRKTPANTSTNFDYNGSYKLFANKFFKDEYGISLPLSWSYSGTVNRPFTKPSSDIPLRDNGIEDLFSDIFTGDLISETSADSARDKQNLSSRVFQSQSESKEFSTSYQKTNYSDNVFLDALFTRPKIEYFYRNNQAISTTASDTTDRYSTRLSYNMSPRTTQTYTPFEKLKKVEFLPKFIKEFQITPLPREVTTTLFNYTYERSHRISRNATTEEVTDPGVLRTVNLDHGLRTNWDPFNFLSIGYTIDITRDFSDQYQRFAGPNFWSSREGGLFAFNNVFSLHDRSLSDSTEEVNYGMLQQEDNRKQNFQWEIKPEFFEWMPLTAKMSTDYNHDKIDETPSLLNSSSNIPEYYKSSLSQTLSFNSSIRFNSLFEDLEKITKPISWLSKGTSSTKKGIDKFKLRNLGGGYSINHNYSGEEFEFETMQQRSISAKQLLAYQFGFLYSPQVLINPVEFWDQMIQGEIYQNGEAEEFDYLAPPLFSQYRSPMSHSISRDANLNTGLTLPGLDLSISTSMNWSQSFALKRDTLNPYSDTTLTWPSLSANFQWGSLYQQFPTLKKHFSSFGLSHGYNYKETRRFNQFGYNGESESFSHQLKPLFKLTFATKNSHRWDVGLDLGYSKSTDYKTEVFDSLPVKTYLDYYRKDKPKEIAAYRRVKDGNLKTENHDFSTNLTTQWSYNLQTKKGIQLWRFFMKLENDLRLKAVAEGGYGKQFSYEYGKLTDTSTTTISRAVKTNDWNVRIRPEVSYNFTQKIDAMGYAQVAYNKELRTDEQDTRWEIEIHTELTMRF